MKVSVDPASTQRLATGNHSGKPAAEDDGEAAFEHVLRHARGKTHSHKTAPTREPSAAEVSRPRWAGFTEPRRIEKGDEGDALEVNAAEKELKTGHSDEPTPLAETRDPLPLLMALNDLHRPAMPGGPDRTASDPRHAPAAGLNETDGKVGSRLRAAMPDTAMQEAATPPVERPVQSLAAGVEKPQPTAGGAATAKSAGPDLHLSPVLASDGLPDNDGEKPLATAVGKGRAEPDAEGFATARSPQDDEPTATTKRVTVIDEQNFPAPASGPVSRTATSLANAIATDGGVRHTVSTPALPAASAALPAHTLKIELHPAELGMVTASLRLAGGQLSIELKPENHEAHRRLSSDTDTIVRSLRDMGLDVDKVTVLQPSLAANGAARAESSGMMANPQGRDASSFQPGNSGGNGAAQGDRQPGRNQGNGGQQTGHGPAHSRDHAGGNLFI